MSLSPQTELLIQRCVDNELSPGDTRQLLKQLDSITDGWKSLACGLLEDRHLRQSLGPANQSATTAIAITSEPAAKLSSATVRSVSVSPQISIHTRQSPATRLRSLWNHPATSLSLCAAIAFVGGMLVSRDAAMPQPNSSGRSTSQALMSRTPGFTVQLPGDAGAGQVPVYESFGALRESVERHPFLQDFGNDQSMRLLVVPTADGRTIVVPIDRTQKPPLQ
jgi:hypothetical protein